MKGKELISEGTLPQPHLMHALTWEIKRRKKDQGHAREGEDSLLLPSKRNDENEGGNERKTASTPTATPTKASLPSTPRTQHTPQTPSLKPSILRRSTPLNSVTRSGKKLTPVLRRNSSVPVRFEGGEDEQSGSFLLEEGLSELHLPSPSHHQKRRRAGGERTFVSPALKRK